MRNIGETEILHAGDIEALARDVLIRAGTEPASAVSTACMIRRAEERGLRRVGLEVLPHMVEHLRAGRVLPDAAPELRNTARAAVECDAAGGFACPAIDKALPRVTELAQATGLASLTVKNAYPIATLAPLSDMLARQGLILVARVVGVVCEPGPGGVMVLALGEVAFGLPSTGTPALPRPLLALPSSPKLPAYEGPFGGPFALTHHLVILRGGLWPEADPTTETIQKSGIAVPARLLEKIITA